MGQAVEKKDFDFEEWKKGMKERVKGPGNNGLRTYQPQPVEEVSDTDLDIIKESQWLAEQEQIAEIGWTKEDIPEAQRHKLTPEQKFIHKATKTDEYNLSPKSLNYFLVKTQGGELKIQRPKLTPKQLALIDLIVSKYASREDYKLLKQPDPEDILTLDDFDTAMKAVKEFEDTFSVTVLDTTEIRKKTGLTRWTDKEIIETAKSLMTTIIEAHGVKVWADEKGKYEDTRSWYSVLCSDVLVDTSGKFKTPENEKRTRIIFSLGLLSGMIFHNDILRKKVILYLRVPKDSKRALYSRSGAVQLIYRYLSLWANSNIKPKLTLQQFGEILGYKKTVNLSVQKKAIEKYLDELKNLGLIKDYFRHPGTVKLETAWTITGVKAE